MMVELAVATGWTLPELRELDGDELATLADVVAAGSGVRG